MNSPSFLIINLRKALLDTFVICAFCWVEALITFLLLMVGYFSVFLFGCSFDLAFLLTSLCWLICWLYFQWISYESHMWWLWFKGWFIFNSRSRIFWSRSFRAISWVFPVLCSHRSAFRCWLCTEDFWPCHLLLRSGLWS